MRFSGFIVVAFLVFGLSGCGSPEEAPVVLHEVCAPAPEDLQNAGIKDEAEVHDFLRVNRIDKVNDIGMNFLIQFTYELRKFPEPLRKRVANHALPTRILIGNGVGEDPEFPKYETTGKDERRWRGVAGAGGPRTTVVANKLYKGHGSTSVVLHEHAHTLDYTGYPGHGGMISSSEEWRKIIAEDSAYREFIKKTCGAYCTESPVEAFAETFAMYYGCEKSRAIVQKSPRVVQFFESLVEAATKN